MLEFRPCPVDEAPAAALVQGMRDEIAALYDGLDLGGPDMPKAGPDQLGPPGGTFVVGFDDGVAVCCGTRAQRMYERAGYMPIENFNANPVASFFAEKRLGR